MRDLTIKDWPMFDKVVRDPEVCALMLEAILGIEVDRIEYADDEHFEKPYLSGRGVRMDVFVKGSGAVYDIEMQTVYDPNLVRRMRYYQVAMDTGALNEGEDYDRLPESYIIFICDHDPFGRGLPRYTMKHGCKEAEGLVIDDGICWVALNAPAWDKEHDAPLSQLLEYVHTGRAEGCLARILDERVRDVNGNEAWKERTMGFMTIEMDQRVKLRQAEKRGYAAGEEAGEVRGEAKGKAEERGRFEALVTKLISEGRLSDLEPVASDPEALSRLMVENGV